MLFFFLVFRVCFRKSSLIREYCWVTRSINDNNNNNSNNDDDVKKPFEQRSANRRNVVDIVLSILALMRMRALLARFHHRPIFFSFIPQSKPFTCETIDHVIDFVYVMRMRATVELAFMPVTQIYQTLDSRGC